MNPTPTQSLTPAHTLAHAHAHAHALAHAHVSAEHVKKFVELTKKLSFLTNFGLKVCH